MSAFNAYMALSDAIDGEVLQDQRMSHRTTWGIGGAAALVVRPNTLGALRRTLEVLERERVDWVILGKGSNVLVADDGYAGCVIVLGRDFARLTVNPQDGTVVAGASLLTSKLVSETLKAQLSGIEFLAGIPGTVGGALAMNAGARSHALGTCVQAVVTLSAHGELRRYEAHELNFGYRSTNIAPSEIVLEVTFKLTPATKELVAAAIERRLQERRSTQPMGKPSAGEVFMDPPAHSVALMAEALNLQGSTQGGAQISAVNPNFIVNQKGATAQDVLALMQLIHESIKQRYGTDLQPEVKFLGFNA